MSVFRQPGVLGRSTRRRVVGVTAALSAAAVEMLAVGSWFVLVVDSRTTSTALAGLGVLFCGSLLRAGVFGATVSDIGDLLQPRRLGVTVLLTTGWLVWLLVAELIGAVPGVVVATVVLAGILTAQFLLEQRVFRRYASTRVPFTPVVRDSCWPSGRRRYSRPAGLPTGASPRHRFRSASRRSFSRSRRFTSACSSSDSSRFSPTSTDSSGFSTPETVCRDCVPATAWRAAGAPELTDRSPCDACGSREDPAHFPCAPTF